MGTYCLVTCPLVSFKKYFKNYHLKNLGKELKKWQKYGKVPQSLLTAITWSSCWSTRTKVNLMTVYFESLQLDSDSSLDQSSSGQKKYSPNLSSVDPANSYSRGTLCCHTCITIKSCSSRYNLPRMNHELIEILSRSIMS